MSSVKFRTTGIKSRYEIIEEVGSGIIFTIIRSIWQSV